VRERGGGPVFRDVARDEGRAASGGGAKVRVEAQLPRRSALVHALRPTNIFQKLPSESFTPSPHLPQENATIREKPG
jgi:hypothetical protein